MKKILICLLMAIPVGALAGSVSDKQDLVQDQAAEIISLVRDVTDANALTVASDRLDDAIEALTGNAGPSPSVQCFNYIKTKGYSLSTAKKTCLDIQTEGAWLCFQDLVDTGYSLSSAKKSCVDMDNPYESECFLYLKNKGYSLNTAKKTSQGIDTSSKFSCFVDLVDTGYSLTTAKKTCIDF